MPISLFQSTEVVGGGGTPPIDTAATGSTLVLVFAGGSGADTTPEDTYANTWGSPVVSVVDSGSKLDIYVCQNATGGDDHSFDVVDDGGNIAISVHEIRGALAASLDTAVTASVRDTSAPFELSGASTLAQANELILTAMFINSGGTLTYDADTDYTLVTQMGNQDVSYGQGVAYKIVSSTGTPNVTWSVTGGSGDYFIGIIALKEGAGSPTVPGVSSTTSINSPTSSTTTPALAAVTATGSVGTVGAVISQTLASHTATGTVNSPTADHTTAALASHSSAGSVGTVVSSEQSGNVTVGLTGVSATGSINGPSLSNQRVLTGLLTIGSVGTIVSEGGVPDDDDDVWDGVSFYPSVAGYESVAQFQSITGNPGV